MYKDICLQLTCVHYEDLQINYNIFFILSIVTTVTFEQGQAHTGQTERDSYAAKIFGNALTPTARLIVWPAIGKTRRMGKFLAGASKKKNENFQTR